MCTVNVTQHRAGGPSYWNPCSGFRRRGFAQTDMHVCTYVQTRTYICMYICITACIHIHIYINLCVYTRTRRNQQQRTTHWSLVSPAHHPKANEPHYAKPLTNYNCLETQAWTHWDLNPRPSACKADVMPLHHVRLEGYALKAAC